MTVKDAPREQSSQTLDLDESVDALFGGKLVLAQRVGGYRFSLDAVLLAAAAKEASGRQVLDLGTGCGVVALAIAHWYRPARIVAVELQPQLVHLAWRNVEANGMAGLIEVVSGDVCHPRSLLEPGFFDLAVCNPPYYPVDEGRLNLDLERAIARHEVRGALADFVGAAAYGLRPRGALLVIYPADRLASLFETLGRNALRAEWLQFVHARAEEPASMVLALSRRQGARPLMVRPPIHVHVGTAYTPLVEALLEGERQRLPGEPALDEESP